MKHVKLFEQFLNDTDSSIDLNNEAENIFESYTLLEEGWLKQVIGYTFFLPLTMVNLLYQLTMKKIKVKKMLKNETNPKKKEALKQQLKGMKMEEVKVKEKIEDQKLKMKDQASKAKSNATPEEKAKYAKQKKAMQDKLNKKKEELRKAQGQYNGLV
jgi:hypothetical protein